MDGLAERAMGELKTEGTAEDMDGELEDPMGTGGGDAMTGERTAPCWRGMRIRAPELSVRCL